MLRVEEGLGWKNYFLSNKKCFLNRDCNALFQSKWRGFWIPPWKYLESFRYSLNDKPLKARKFYLEPTLATHDYGKIIERIFVPQKIPALVSFLKLKEGGEIKLKIEVNHRRKEENFDIGDKKEDSKIERLADCTGKSYEIKKGKKFIEVEGRDRYTCITTEGDFKFNEIGKHEIYQPLYEKKQDKFIVGELKKEVEEGDKLPVFFLFGKKKSKMRKQLKKLNDWEGFRIEKQADRKEELKNFKFSGLDLSTNLYANSLMNLKHKYNYGEVFLAGLPYFTQFWSRDFAWMAFGLLEMGRFEEVKAGLKTLFNFMKEGEIPTVMDEVGKPKYYSADSTLLTLIALAKYVKYTGDIEFFKTLEKKVEKSLEWIRRHRNNKLLEVKGKKTWMDTLKREGYPIEIQSYLAEAFKEIGEIYKHLGYKEKGEKLKEKGGEVIKSLDYFWMEEEELFCDRIKEEKIRELTINSLVPLYFGQVDSRRAERIIKRYNQPDFMTKKGIRSCSTDSQGYQGTYHQGWVWQLTNGIYACACLRYSKPELAWKMLKKMEADLFEYSIRGLSEVFNDKDLSSSGAGLQGWSSALVINAIDSFLLGIKPNALKKKLKISPSVPKNLNTLTRKNKKVGSQVFRLKVKREKSRQKIETRGLENWEVERV